MAYLANDLPKVIFKKNSSKRIIIDAIVVENIVCVVIYLNVTCYKIISIIKYPTWIYDLYDIQQKTIQVVEKSMKVILLS